jgi:hypothetical protein
MTPHGKGRDYPALLVNGFVCTRCRLRGSGHDCQDRACVCCFGDSAAAGDRDAACVRCRKPGAYPLCDSCLAYFQDGWGTAGHAQAVVHEPVSACGVSRCGILGVHEHTIYGDRAVAEPEPRHEHPSETETCPICFPPAGTG